MNRIGRLLLATLTLAVLLIAPLTGAQAIVIFPLYDVNFVADSTNLENPFKTIEIHSHESPVPTTADEKPVRANTEEGRSGDTFLDWFEDAEFTEPAGTTDTVKALWEAQGEKQKESRPTITLYARWDKAPLLEVKDVTITAGDEFDVEALVSTVTDTEDDAAGKPVTRAYSGDYDVNTPGQYPIKVTATDSAGGTHTLTATLTVLTKAVQLNEAPVLEVKDVTITAGDTFKVEDVFTSVTDTEDDATGKPVTLAYSGDYDVNTPGQYPIKVTATDSAGATTTKTATLTVVAPESPSTPEDPDSSNPSTNPSDSVNTPSADSRHDQKLPQTGSSAGSTAMLALTFALLGAGTLVARRRLS